MPYFTIDFETVLGISHSGEVTAEGEGTVELTDEEVQQLIDLIRENGGEGSEPQKTATTKKTTLADTAT